MNETEKSLDRGFSLLEAVIVLGLVAILVAVAVPALYRTYQNYRAQTAVERISKNPVLQDWPPLRNGFSTESFLMIQLTPIKYKQIRLRMV
jgi:prepilin-type N-terminal cleavage/methylation domain-containing protein